MSKIIILYNLNICILFCHLHPNKAVNIFKRCLTKGVESPVHSVKIDWILTIDQVFLKQEI